MDSSPESLIVIESAAHTGSWNMAVDESLLESARTSERSTLRFYRWNSPTLSLGYFQKQKPANLPDELAALPFVRRLSGGGAILHHHEWTYSFAIPANHSLADQPQNLYAIAHTEIVGLLAEYEIPAQLRGRSQGELPDEPFLCFGRQDPRDIVLGGYKIVGSAQRRRRGAVLQHGSILLEASEYVPSYPGLFDLCGKRMDFDEIIPELAQRMAVALEFADSKKWINFQTELPPDLADLAANLERKNADANAI